MYILSDCVCARNCWIIIFAAFKLMYPPFHTPHIHTRSRNNVEIKEFSQHPLVEKRSKDSIVGRFRERETVTWSIQSLCWNSFVGVLSASWIQRNCLLCSIQDTVSCALLASTMQKVSNIVWDECIAAWLSSVSWVATQQQNGAYVWPLSSKTFTSRRCCQRKTFEYNFNRALAHTPIISTILETSLQATHWSRNLLREVHLLPQHEAWSKDWASKGCKR